MSGETPPERSKSSTGTTRKKQPSRQLNLPSRVRSSFRRELDRLLDLDAVLVPQLIYELAVPEYVPNSHLSLLSDDAERLHQSIPQEGTDVKEPFETLKVSAGGTPETFRV